MFPSYVKRLIQSSNGSSLMACSVAHPPAPAASYRTLVASAKKGATVRRSADGPLQIASRSVVAKRFRIGHSQIRLDYEAASSYILMQLSYIGLFNQII